MTAILRILKPCLALLVLCPFLDAQANRLQPPGSNGAWMITGYVLTATPVNISSLVSSGSLTAAPPGAGQTIWMCGGDVNAASGTSVTITLRDGNGGYFWNGINPLNPSAASSFNFPFGGGGAGFTGCRPFPNGLLVSASSAATITFSGWGVY